MESSLAYLEDLSKDLSVERALNDRTSALLHEAIELCKTLIGFAKSQRIDAESILSAEVEPSDRERKLNLFSLSSKPTFEKLRAYFAADGADVIVAEFDKAEAERKEGEAIRNGRA